MLAFLHGTPAPFRFIQGWFHYIVSFFLPLFFFFFFSFFFHDFYSIIVRDFLDSTNKWSQPRLSFFFFPFVRRRLSESVLIIPQFYFFSYLISLPVRFAIPDRYYFSF